MMYIHRSVIVADQLVSFAIVRYFIVCYQHDIAISLSDMTRGACRNGDIRLRPLPGRINKLVQICFAGSWGQICADGWDNNDARVACRQVGMPENCECQVLFIY